ncbi:MAG: hypothetical protein F6K35_24125 [Okeania sp. SIO2H7]|nr:hypothetical protein [Okeania sp. SIO2H7]
MALVAVVAVAAVAAVVAVAVVAAVAAVVVVVAVVVDSIVNFPTYLLSHSQYGHKNRSTLTLNLLIRATFVNLLLS